MFAAFILACGATHFLDVLAFWIPVYRLNALLRFITGVISWATVFYLVKYLPFLFSLKSQKELELEIAQRKKAEEKFKGLLEAAPDAMVITNEKGEIVLVNLQTENMFGYTKEELIGKLVEILIPSELHKKHIIDRTHYLGNPKARTMGSGLELNAKRKNGLHFPVEISLAPLVTSQETLISASIRDITLRKAAEEKLKKAKSDFQLLVSSIKDYAIFLLDNEGHVASWNSGAEHIKGYTETEVIGKPMEIFYTKEEIERGEPQRNLQMALDLGHYRTEGLRLKKDGSVFYADVAFTSLKNEKGELYGYAKVTRDITEKRKADQSIRFLASIANSIQDPVISSDTDYNVTDWNEPAEKLFGWKREETIGKKSNDFLKVKYPYESREQILQSLAAKDYWHGEVIYHSKSGQPIDALATASHLKDENGNVNGNLVVIRDITKRKQAEQALSKLNDELEQRVEERTEQIKGSEKKYRYLFENNPVPLFVMDLQTFRYIDVNEAALLQYGYSREEFLTMTALEIRPDKDITSFREQDHSFRPDCHDYNKGVWNHKKKDGTIIQVEIIAHEILYEGIPARLVLSKDVTEQKKVEQLIKTLNAELERKVVSRTEELEKAKNEMEAFTYSVSHDLRAPLRGIVGFTNILEEDYSSKFDEEARRITTIIKVNTLKMGHLIDDLLAFSRMGKQDIIKTTIDTQAMVHEIMQEQMAHYKSQQEICWDIRELLPMLADMSTIRQVWINLISNAIKYSRNTKAPRIEIGSYIMNGQHVYYVQDNGVGFDEQYKQKLFKVFQRLHAPEEFEGTGVGLALVDKIVSKHGGKVWAKGKENAGACFSFSLPV